MLPSHKIHKLSRKCLCQLLFYCNYISLYKSVVFIETFYFSLRMESKNGTKKSFKFFPFFYLRKIAKENFAAIDLFSVFFGIGKKYIFEGIFWGWVDWATFGGCWGIFQGNCRWRKAFWGNSFCYRYREFCVSIFAIRNFFYFIVNGIC